MKSISRGPLLGFVVVATCFTGCGSGGNSEFGAGANGSGVNGTNVNGNGTDLGLTGGTGTGGSGTGLDSASACVSEERDGEQVPIDLYFMVDTTGSMSCPTGPAGATCSQPPKPAATGPTRWSEVQKALIAFVGASTNAGLGAGIGFFPLPATGAGQKQGSIACNAADYATPAQEIAALPGAAAAIVASINQQTPAGSTPTSPSLKGAIQYATARAVAHPDRHVAIVYATDGIPQGCDNTNTIANAAAAVKVAAAGNPSILTYVLGVGPKLTSLNDIAVAGGTGQAYLVDSANVADDFANALTSIRTRVLTCDYSIPASSKGPLDFSRVNVKTQVGPAGTLSLVKQVADKTKCDATAGGWYYDKPESPSIVSLCPTSCNPLLMTPGSKLKVEFGCLTVTQPVD